MPLDIALLATTVATSFLVPYVKVGLEKIAEGAGKQVGEKAGEYVADLTGKLWGRVKSVFSSPEDQTVLTLFEKNPDEMQAMMIKALQEKLTQDPALAQQLADLIDQPGPDGTSTGAQIMNAGIAGIADLRGANLSHAQNLNIAGVILDDVSPPDQPPE